MLFGVYPFISSTFGVGVYPVYFKYFGSTLVIVIVIIVIVVVVILLCSLRL